MGEELDPLAQSLLQEGQNKGERGVDVVATVVHEFTEEFEFLTAGLKLHQLTQPMEEEGRTKMR